MEKRMLVVGAGPGLGKFLLENSLGFEKKFALSRSGKVELNDVELIVSDVNDLQNHLNDIDSPLSLVVYLPSLWGESGLIQKEEFDDFVKNGPSGLLNCFHVLNEANLLANNALIVNVGSIASESAYLPTSASSFPVYSISKATQKSVVSQLARTHKKYRFATITLGSIGDENGGVGMDNIMRTIELLNNLKPGVRYTEVEVYSDIDIK